MLRNCGLWNADCGLKNISFDLGHVTGEENQKNRLNPKSAIRNPKLKYLLYFTGYDIEKILSREGCSWKKRKS
jgi:hypothetical protein